jgi:hypothetical protein
MSRSALFASLALVTFDSGAVAQLVDLSTLSTQPGGTLQRTHGSTGTGIYGVPVAGGVDVDEDGFSDIAFAALTADPFGRTDAGEVYLVFGDGTTSGVLDTGVLDDRILVIVGVGSRENAGSEIWMDDVTGDGIGDLLIARQNFNPGGRPGAGALSIVAGGKALSDLAATQQPLDLGAPPAAIVVTNLIGPSNCDRLGIWVRTGDVTGDQIADLVVGADLEGSNHRGSAYVVRGGGHLASGADIDLASFGSTAIAGHIARLTPPAGVGSHSHFGATVQIGDLDGDALGEVFVAATLNRAGASLLPSNGKCSGNHGSGGEPQGTLYIAWDDNFAANPWPAGFEFAMDAAPGTSTSINGSGANLHFGEEILAGYDFDDDGDPDLFVGDIVGDASPLGNRPRSGHGYVFYGAASLAGLDFDMSDPPAGVTTTLVQGARSGDLAGDTVVAGDFDGDGIDDLAIASPHFDPAGRDSAGAYHVLHGRSGAWPEFVDLLFLPDPALVRVTEVWGAEGSGSPGNGDTLGYSAVAGFIDGDARIDLISNEMVGDGIQPGTTDVGNLVVISGVVIAPESTLGVLAAAALATVFALRRRGRTSSL